MKGGFAEWLSLVSELCQFYLYYVLDSYSHISGKKALQKLDPERLVNFELTIYGFSGLIHLILLFLSTRKRGGLSGKKWFLISDKP